MKKLKQDDFFDLIQKSPITLNQYKRLLDFSKHDTWQYVCMVPDNQILFDEEYLFETKQGKCLITKKGEDLIKKVEKLFRTETAGSKKVDSEFIANVDAYRQLFPAIKLPTGVYARSAMKNLEPAMIWFFENFNYTWDTVLKATKLYLNEKEMSRYQFCKNSQYFIRKENGTKQWISELANYCENILNGADENEKNFFETRVV
jgi:hypothetical protein